LVKQNIHDEVYFGKAPTLGEAMEGKATWENYTITDGYWHYAKEPLTLKDNTVSRGVIAGADFGKFNDYQGVLVGLSLVFNIEDGGGVGWSFESMKDIQILFNEAKATKLNDLIGTPILLVFSMGGGPGSRILGCKVNKSLVVRKEDATFADKVSFLIGKGEKL